MFCLVLQIKFTLVCGGQLNLDCKLGFFLATAGVHHFSDVAASILNSLIK